MDLKNLAVIDPNGVFKEGDSFFCHGMMLGALYDKFSDVKAEPFLATASCPEGSSFNSRVFKVTLKERNPDLAAPILVSTPGGIQKGGKRNPSGWQHRSANIFRQLGVGQGWIFSCGTNDGEIYKVIKGILCNITAKNNLRCARQQITLVNTSTGEVVQGYYVEAVEVIDAGDKSG